MIDFAVVLHFIKTGDTPTPEIQSYIDEWNADKDAFTVKYRALYPHEQGAIDMLRDNTNTEL